MTNYISYSLYGANDYYITGAIENLKNNQHILPDWQSIFYISSQFDFKVSKELANLGAHIEIVEGSENYISTIWRFFATSKNDADAILFRDCDSLITQREKTLVENWLDSNMAVHLIRDHPFHSSPIMAGLCGVRKPKVDNLREIFLESKLANIYGIDQWFAYTHLYRKNYHSILIHDSIFYREFKSYKFQNTNNVFDFIGARITHGSEPFDKNSISVLNSFKNSLFFKWKFIIIDFLTFKYKYLKFDIFFRYNIFKSNV